MEQIDKIRIKKINIMYFIWFAINFLLLIFTTALILQNRYNASLVCLLLILATNSVCSFICIEKYFIFLMFNLCLFLFLMGRPFVSLIQGEVWWDVASNDGIKKALLSLELCLITLPIGANIAKQTAKNKVKGNAIHYEFKDEKMIRMRNAAFIFFAIALIGSFADGYYKILFMSSHTYTEYYVEYSSELPIILRAFARLLKPSFCFYLATMPNKKESVLALILYTVTTIPYLIIGMRSPTMLALLFCFTYFCIRHFYYTDGEVWIGKLEKILIILSLPILIMFCYAYNFIRTDRDYSINASFVLDFFYQQGISFDVLAQGFDILDILPLKGWPGYMLGPLYDNLFYNNLIGRILTNSDALVGQSMDTIIRSHDMKQHLSYMLMGNAYLLGYGKGSVYILEVVHDIGWIGLIAFSIWFGRLTVRMLDYFVSNRIIVSTIFIYALLQIYYIPRSDALYFIQHIVDLYFWIPIAGIIILSKIKIPQFRFALIKKT